MHLPLGYPSGWEWVASFHWNPLEPTYGRDVIPGELRDGWEPHPLDIDLVAPMFDHRVEAD